MKIASVLCFVACAIGLQHPTLGPMERVSAAAESAARARVLSPACRVIAGDRLTKTPHPEGVSEPQPADDGLPTDAEIALKERIQRALLATDTLTYAAKHVSVGVHGHDVTLYGEVETIDEKQRLARIVSRVRGVRRVYNRVTVLDRMPPANDLSR